jgi:hypothetical protein
MTPLGHIDQEALSATLRQRGLDGWLVYDFHDSNPVPDGDALAARVPLASGGGTGASGRA